MKEIFETCQPRDEVLKGELREDLFSARLKDVIDGKADPVYQDPALFFDNTYPTDGLRLLLDEALGRLTGVKPANNAIIRLDTAFGGGKTHNLIALYHVACGYRPLQLGMEKELIPARGAGHTHDRSRRFRPRPVGRGDSRLACSGRPRSRRHKSPASVV